MKVNKTSVGSVKLGKALKFGYKIESVLLWKSSTPCWIGLRCRRGDRSFLVDSFAQKKKVISFLKCRK